MASAAPASHAEARAALRLRLLHRQARPQPALSRHEALHRRRDPVHPRQPRAELLFVSALRRRAWRPCRAAGGSGALEGTAEGEKRRHRSRHARLAGVRRSLRGARARRAGRTRPHGQHDGHPRERQRRRGQGHLLGGQCALPSRQRHALRRRRARAALHPLARPNPARQPLRYARAFRRSLSRSAMPPA